MSSAKASVTPIAQHGGGRPIEPDFASFARRYDEGTPQVAWTRLVADLETPVSAMLKLAHERPNSFLLESVEGGATRGRYSIIGCEPDLIWRADGGKAEINRAPQSDAEASLIHRDSDAIGGVASRRPACHDGEAAGESPVPAQVRAVVTVSRLVSRILSGGALSGLAWVAIHLRGLPGGCPWRGGRAARAPCSALLRVGFVEPPGSLRALVRSCRTVSPLPAPQVLPRLATRASRAGGLLFCGTFPGVAPAGRYPAPFVRGARTFLPAALSGPPFQDFGGAAVQPTDPYGMGIKCREVKSAEQVKSGMRRHRPPCAARGRDATPRSGRASPASCWWWAPTARGRT